VSEYLKRDPLRLFPDWHPYGGTLGPDLLGAPRLFVADSDGTVDLRREIPQYRWRDLTPALTERADQPEEPLKKNDHACDALRYGVMARAGGIPVAPSSKHTPGDTPTERRMVSAGLADAIF
jgi:hypothetical protein